MHLHAKMKGGSTSPKVGLLISVQVFSFVHFNVDSDLIKSPLSPQRDSVIVEEGDSKFVSGFHKMKLHAYHVLKREREVPKGAGGWSE